MSEQWVNGVPPAGTHAKVHHDGKWRNCYIIGSDGLGGTVYRIGDELFTKHGVSDFRPIQELSHDVPELPAKATILCDYFLCGGEPIHVNKGDVVIVHQTVDFGYGCVCLISDSELNGTGTIIFSQLNFEGVGK